MTTYAARLDAARRLLGELRTLGQAGLPVDLADQLGAATRDTYQHLYRMAAILPILDGGGWRSHAADDPGPEVDESRARTLAATMTFVACPHLRDPYAPQPVYARMPLRRLDCARCVRTLPTPPPGDADRCDWCGARGVTTFWPLVLACGPMLATGDACGDCHAALVPEGQQGRSR